MTIKFTEMKDVANKTDASYMNLVGENNDALVPISELETKTSNLESLFKKTNEIEKPVFDTTMLERKVLELDKVNIRVSTLELKISNLVDSLQEKDKLLSFLLTVILNCVVRLSQFTRLNVKGWRKTFPIKKLN